MKRPTHLFVLDTSVFVQAHRNYYAHDICPGFWNLLDHFALEGFISSIDRVQEEIFAPDEPDELTAWAIQAPSSFFKSTGEQAVIGAYQQMQSRLQRSAQFSADAKLKFGEAADGWVVAYARAHGAAVVTQEVYSANVKKRIPIPNVCLEFDVTHIDTFEMLRQLGAHFYWQQP